MSASKRAAPKRQPRWKLYLYVLDATPRSILAQKNLRDLCERYIKGLMKILFTNLFTNALKFTRRLPVAVIEVGADTQDGETVFRVCDNGVGFNMKYADKLFGIFQRLHSSDEFEGTGVGLATVKRIVQKHGGRIWAKAELDKGAGFYFTLASSQECGENYKAIAAGERS